MLENFSACVWQQRFVNLGEKNVCELKKCDKKDFLQLKIELFLFEERK